MRKVTVYVAMDGKDLSVMFQKNNVLIQPALAMVLASWEYAFVFRDTKEKSVRKVCAIFLLSTSLVYPWSFKSLGNHVDVENVRKIRILPDK